MAQQIGYKDGKLVSYDPNDPLSSYGVQPAAPTGNVNVGQTLLQPAAPPSTTGTFENPQGGSIESNVAQESFKQSAYTGTPTEVSGTMQTIGSEPYAYGVTPSSALTTALEPTLTTTTTEGGKTTITSQKVSGKEAEQIMAQQISISQPSTTLFGGGQTKGTGATGIWIAPQDVSSTYNPSTGMITTETLIGNKTLIDKSLFYGFPSQTIGGSMTTATSTKPKDIFSLIETPTISKQGWGATPTLLLTGGAMVIPSLVATGFEILKTPFEVAQFGPQIIPAKLWKYGTEQKEQWMTYPIESTLMTAGALAFTWGLGKGIQLLKTSSTTKSIGQDIINVESVGKEESVFIGKSRINTPELNTDIYTDYVGKTVSGEPTATLKVGELSAWTRRTWLSKIAGEEVFTVREAPLGFGQVGISTGTELMQIEAAKTITGLTDITESGAVSELTLKGQGFESWASAVKSSGARTLLRTDISFPTIGEETGGGGMLALGLKTKPILEFSLDVAKQTAELIKTLPMTPTLPILPLPVTFPKTQTITKQSSNLISISKQTSITKQVPISIGIPKQTAISISFPKQDQMFKSIQLEMPTRITKQSTMQLQTPTQISRQTSIQIQTPSQISKQTSIEIPMISQKTMSLTGLRTPTITPPSTPITFVPPPPVFGFPNLPEGGLGFGRPSSMFRPSKRKTIYTSSLVGQFTGLKVSKVPSFTTGGEIRGILTPFSKSRKRMFSKPKLSLSRSMFKKPSRRRRKRR